MLQRNRKVKPGEGESIAELAFRHRNSESANLVRRPTKANVDVDYKSIYQAQMEAPAKLASIRVISNRHPQMIIVSPAAQLRARW